MTTEGLPTISILVVNKDSVETLGRCLDSLFALDYPNVHIVVQDGVSTDGSLELLRSYGDRIDLVSEKDRDQNDAFVRGLRRCTGDIVGFCWADEELLPHAARWAVEHLGDDPAVGAIYGDFIETDAAGVGENPCKYPEWSFERVYA